MFRFQVRLKLCIFSISLKVSGTAPTDTKNAFMAAPVFVFECKYFPTDT